LGLQKLLNNFAIETSMREDLFQLVDAVLNKNESLDIESQHLLTKQHQQYIRNGLKLPVGPKRDRFKEVQLRLSELQLEFRKNQNEDEGGIWFLPQELEGVPEDFLSSLDKGTKENEGKLFLNFDYPHLMPILMYAKNGETRRRQFIGHEKKCVTNVPVFRETILLRDEAARLLGYPNHASFRIEAKMAKTSEAVNVFLEDLRHRLMAGAEAEVANLKLLKKADVENRGELYDDKLFYWDRQFYHQIMLQTQYSVNQQQIAEYFPLKTTIQGMLNIFQNLFGMNFVEIAGVERGKLGCSGKESDLVWQDDVQVFAVWDDEAQRGGFLGYLYLDLFPQENKYGGAVNFNLQLVSTVP
jgi:metallopeptidase MepB